MVNKYYADSDVVIEQIDAADVGVPSLTWR